MSRTPARVTQADIARAIRAAQQTNAGEVLVLPDGSIRIQPVRSAAPLNGAEVAPADSAGGEEVDDGEVIPLT